MRSPRHQAHRVEGMVIVFALLVVFVGTIVLAAWVQVLATRALSAETALQAQQRRIAIGNGRALARQFVLEQMPAGAFAITNGNATISGGWGGFSIAGAPSGFWTQTNLFEGNVFSAVGPFSFRSVFTGNLTAGAASEPWTFQVRTRSPFTAGFPLIIHNNASTNVLNSQARRINWTNLAGLLNVPPTPETWGVNSTNSYAGYFSGDLRTNLPSTVPTTNFVGYTNATSNSITLTISPPTDSTIVRFTATNVLSSSSQRFTNDSGAPVYTNRTHTVTALRIVGSTGTNFLQVVIPATNSGFTRITLDGTNSRRTSIYRLGGNLTITNTTANAAWRTYVTLSNAPLTVQMSGGLTIGGIRTDSSVSVSGGTLNFLPETNLSLIDFYSDRMMWLEDNRTP